MSTLRIVESLAPHVAEEPDRTCPFGWTVDGFKVVRVVQYEAVAPFACDGPADRRRDPIPASVVLVVRLDILVAHEMGRPSLAPGRYFRLLLVGYFEGIDSERGIAWRAADSLAVRSFLQ